MRFKICPSTLMFSRSPSTSTTQLGTFSVNIFPTEGLNAASSSFDSRKQPVLVFTIWAQGGILELYRLRTPRPGKAVLHSTDPPIYFYGVGALTRQPIEIPTADASRAAKLFATRASSLSSKDATNSGKDILFLRETSPPLNRRQAKSQFSSKVSIFPFIVNSLH